MVIIINKLQVGLIIFGISYKLIYLVKIILGFHLYDISKNNFNDESKNRNKFKF